MTGTIPKARHDGAAAEADARRVPERDEAVLRHVLERRAAMHPERPFLRFPDGAMTTYGAFCASVRSLAAGLASIGVKQGDTVNVWLPNTSISCGPGLRSIGSAPSTCRSTRPIAAACFRMF